MSTESMQSENLFRVLTLRSEQFEIIIRVNQFADNLLQAGANLHQSNANFSQLKKKNVDLLLLAVSCCN
jgi:hypothetical protein